MTETGSLRGKTLIISGGSRGIGEAVAIRAARDGANIALLAKTAEPHPKLPGTIYTAAAAIEEAGGRALPIVGDVRDDESVAGAVAQTVERFGGIDIVVNNASAIDLTATDDIPMKKYDLMQDINARGTFALSKAAIEHLRKSENPHILTFSPPVDLAPEWFDQVGAAYTVSKFGMTILTLGFARELAADGIAANTLWPRTSIATAAVRNLLSEEMLRGARSADIMSDAAYAVLTKPAAEFTGRCLIDDDVLAAERITDFEPYRAEPGTGPLELDFWMRWPDRSPGR